MSFDFLSSVEICLMKPIYGSTAARPVHREGKERREIIERA